MNNRNKYIRKVIGTLIKHYRKKNSFYINDFIYEDDDFYKENCLKCNECKIPHRICSKNTLYRLEDGKVIQKECVYHRLAHKLGKRVILNRMDFYIRLETYRNLLIESLIDFSKLKLIKLEAQITHDLYKYENVLYISEILLLYKSIIQDKLYSANTEKKDIQTFLSLKDILVEDDKKLIIYHLYTASFKRGNFGIDFENVITESKLYINDPLFYQIKLDIINNQNHLIALNDLVKNELANIDSLNKYQKFRLYYALEFALTNSCAFEESYKVLIKAKDIVEMSDFGDRALKNCYLRLGFVSYCLEQYENTEKWMMKAFEIDHSISKNFVILCSALEKIKKFDLIKKVINLTDISKNKTPYNKKTYIYYKIKYEKEKLSKRNLELLEDLICNDLKPYLNNYGQIHTKIFENDLIEYIKITGNREKFFEFSTK